MKASFVVDCEKKPTGDVFRISGKCGVYEFFRIGPFSKEESDLKLARLKHYFSNKWIEEGVYFPGDEPQS